MAAVQLTDITYTYPGTTVPALSGVSFAIARGEEAALVGRGGAGKSTLGRVLAGLLEPDDGTVSITDTDGLPGRVGLVFQNPENQLIGLTVEEDVAFGPGNLGWPHGQIAQHVSDALAVCGLTAMRTRSVATLSGGEKQRVAIAGALAMQPTCLVLDEATAMLDRPSQQALNAALLNVKHQLGIAILRITHALDEALPADRVVVLHNGSIVANGHPWDVLWDADELAVWGLAPPALYKAARPLVDAGMHRCRQVRTAEELAHAVWPYISPT